MRLLGQSGSVWSSLCLCGGCAAAQRALCGPPVCSWATHSQFTDNIKAMDRVVG